MGPYIVYTELFLLKPFFFFLNVFYWFVENVSLWTEKCKTLFKWLNKKNQDVSLRQSRINEMVMDTHKKIKNLMVSRSKSGGRKILDPNCTSIL